MMKSTFLLSSVNVILIITMVIIMVQPCLIQFPNNFKRNHNRFTRNLYPASLSLNNQQCVCGQETSHKGKTWVVFVNVPFQISKSKQCVGTVVAHNLVITSHKCLAQEGKHIFPYEAWESRPTHHVEYMTNPANVTIATYQEKAYKVKTIVYNLDYSIYAGVDSLVSASDIAVIVVDGDLFELVDFDDGNGTEYRAHFRLPVCLAGGSNRKNEAFLENVVHRHGYYYGVGGEFVDDVTPEFRMANELAIMAGEECAEEQHFEGFVSAGSLCTKTVVSLPKTGGGPLLTTNVSGHLIVPLEDLQGETLAITPQTTFLVGISTLAETHAKGKRMGYTYFSNVLQNVHFIEWVAQEHNSLWCPTPQLAATTTTTTTTTDINSSAGPEEEEIEDGWPWEVKPTKRSETANCACGYSNWNKGRIAGGKETFPYEFSWLIKIFLNWDPSDPKFQKSFYICAASIINDRVLLTAAHCLIEDKDTGNNNGVPYETVSNFVLQVGSHFLVLNDYLAKEVKSKQFIIHPGYLPSVKNDEDGFDVALIILDKPLNLSNVTSKPDVGQRDIRPICLPKIGQKIELENGTLLTVTGWGHRNPWEDNPKHPSEMQYLRVPVRDKKYCADQYFATVPDTVQCVGNFTTKYGVTEGDTGGPLAFVKPNLQYFQVGIVSYAYDIEPSKPGIPSGKGLEWITFFTDVQQFLPFIEYYSQKHGAKWCKH